MAGNRTPAVCVYFFELGDKCDGDLFSCLIKKLDNNFIRIHRIAAVLRCYPNCINGIAGVFARWILEIEAAFVNAVLRKGDFNGVLEDVASMTDNSSIDRILANAVNQGTRMNQFLTFKNRALTPITFEDVKRLSVAELGQRIVAAMN